MKAKLPQGEKPVEAAKYLCVWCDTEFFVDKDELACPTCGNSDIKDIVPIYLEDDPQEEALYCPVDFSGG